MKPPIKNKRYPIVNPQGSDEEMLNTLLKETFSYFLKEVNPKNGLIADKTQPGSASSIAAVGLGLTAYVAAVERKLLSRTTAVKKTLAVLRFFYRSKQGSEPNATGYKGFYYHFLDMKTGKRACKSELSTVDTAILMAGILTAKQYFNGQNKGESEIRTLADKLYLRVNWQWALNNGKTISHGWKPESGFLKYRWNNNYSEAHILYALALGSPAFRIDPIGYKEWISTFKCRKDYGIKYLHAGPLFIHQMSHLWIDFRGIHDEFNRKVKFDYFENSHRATLVQQQYAIDNPKGFTHYTKNSWGFTASDGPGPKVLKVNGIRRVFYDYVARGVPFGPDDGTISPWAVVASLPFAPRIVLRTIRHAIERLNLKSYKKYGFDSSFNPTFPEKKFNANTWVSPYRFGLNQGPVIIMIENHQTELVWNIIKTCPYIVTGLTRAGFKGGWLEVSAHEIRAKIKK